MTKEELEQIYLLNRMRQPMYSFGVTATYSRPNYYTFSPNSGHGFIRNMYKKCTYCKRIADKDFGNCEGCGAAL